MVSPDDRLQVSLMQFAVERSDIAPRAAQRSVASPQRDRMRATRDVRSICALSDCCEWSSCTRFYLREALNPRCAQYPCSFRSQRTQHPHAIFFNSIFDNVIFCAFFLSVVLRVFLSKPLDALLLRARYPST